MLNLAWFVLFSTVPEVNLSSVLDKTHFLFFLHYWPTFPLANIFLGGGKVLFYSPERRKPLGYEMSIGQMFVGLCRSRCTGSCIRGCPDTFNVLQTYRFTVTGTVHCDLAQFPSTIQHSLCGGVCVDAKVERFHKILPLIMKHVF